MTQPTIRVMLVDDHAVVRQGFKIFIDAHDDLELVGEAQNGQDAVRLCGEIQPDVILMDMVMPQMGGIEAIKQIRDAYPDVQIIALTSFNENEDMVQSALHAGAQGYLFKDVSIDEIATAIRNAHAGKMTLSPEAARMLVQASAKPKPMQYQLSERETQVLRLLVDGLNNRQIAEKLIISTATAKFHVSKILSKLGVSTRTEAAAVAVQNDLI